jgi:hypothetical protein
LNKSDLVKLFEDNDTEENTNDLIEDTDLKLQLELARMEILELKNKTNELIIENLKLKNECLS